MARKKPQMPTSYVEKLAKYTIIGFWVYFLKKNWGKALIALILIAQFVNAAIKDDAHNKIIDWVIESATDHPT